MAENSENIEAKLCAYVEGDLDAAGRVEIEKHLEQHPNHRRLLAELTTTRDLLRQLPREQAPSELAEAFNAQLERSALLDSPAADANSTDIRGNLLPRVLAMAAIVLLTVGLGVVVYFALPHGGSRTQLAMPEPATRPMDDGAVALDTDVSTPASRAPAGEVAEKRGGPTAEGALAGAGADRMFKAGGPPAGTPDAAVPDEVVSNTAPSPTAEAIARVHGKSGRPPVQPVYVIVTAADKMQAVRDATTLLADSRIEWSPAPDEAVTPSDQSLAQQPPQQQAEAADQESFQLNQQQVGQQQQVAQQEQVGQQEQQQQGATYAQVELNNALVKKYQRQGHAQAQAPRAAEVPPEPYEVAQADNPAKQKAEAKDAPGDRIAADPRAESAAAPPPSESPADVKELRAEVNDAQVQTQPFNQLAQRDLALRADVSAIKARMTRSQLVELSRALNRGSQQVELIADDPQLQSDNDWLQEQQRLPTPLASTRGTVAKDGPGGAWARAQPVQRPAAPSPAAGPTTRPSSPINLEAGPGPTTRPTASQIEVAAATPAPQRTPPPPANAAARDRQVNLRQGPGPGARPERIRAGEKLNVTVDELGGPGTDRTAVAEVGPDGTIRLPKLNEPLRVDGLTRAQAESVIGDAYKRSAGFDRATVRVEPADAPLANAARPASPATGAQRESAAASLSARGGVGPRPDAPADRAGGGAGEQPPNALEPPADEQVASRGRETSKSDGFAAGVSQQDLDPSTAPAPATAPVAGSDEESVEVVILVQGNAGSDVPAVAPQSQPAGVEDVAPSDEADVQPAPVDDIPAPEDGAAPNSADVPTAPADTPSELTNPND